MRLKKHFFFTKPVLSWTLYDWACTAFPTIITTFIFSTYFSEKVADNKITGMAQWADAVGLAGLIIALLSPVLGAIADYEGRRKPWLAIFTVINIISSALLWYAQPSPSYVTWALTCVVFGTIGLEVSMVFYNAMLSDLAPPAYTGRISGWSWGAGYFGGLASLIIALYVFIQGNIPWLHLDKNSAEHIRAVGPLVAIWCTLFAWPLFVFTPDQASTGLGITQAVQRGIRSLGHTLISLKEYKEVMKFLLARMLYIDGLNTVFAFGGIYAAGTIGMSITEVIEFGIGMNVAAGIGATAFAWMDDYKGSKLTVLITLAIMIAAGSGMLLVQSKTWFWILGMGLSLCVGPIQAASRSLLIHIAPHDLITEMFGLYAFSGKATSFIGPWVLGAVAMITQSQRLGMSTVIIFLVTGALLLTVVKVPQKEKDYTNSRI